MNNPLMALSMNIDRLGQISQAGGNNNIEAEIEQAARFTEMKVEEISSVIAILRDIASPQFITYMDDIKMLDIDGKVQDRLHQIKEKYKG